MIVLDPTSGTLRSAYLGDSVFNVYRRGEEILSAPEQQHSFNFPLQVGTGGDSPTAAARINLQMIEGDTVVVGSDGVWDNLQKSRLHMIVRNAYTLDMMAQEIGNIAFRYSLMSEYVSPFYEKAFKCGINAPKSGKSDDITVITARIVKTKAH